MSSPEERAATSRQNGQKSRGPISEAGKAVSAQNSLKHGLSGQAEPLPWENKQSFRELQTGLSSALEPRGMLEEFFVGQIAQTCWRLLRSDLIESGLFVKEDFGRRIAAQYTALVRYEKVEPTPDEFLLAIDTPKTVVTDIEAHASVLQKISGLKAEAAETVPAVAVGFMQDASGPEMLVKVGRHRIQSQRALYRLLHELSRLQASRQAGGGGHPESGVSEEEARPLLT